MKPKLTQGQKRAMAEAASFARRRAEIAARERAVNAPPIPVTFGADDAGLVLPDGLPCNCCGQPVSPRKGLVTVVEKVPGQPLWSVLHTHCARWNDCATRSPR